MNKNNTEYRVPCTQIPSVGILQPFLAVSFTLSVSCLFSSLSLPQWVCIWLWSAVCPAVCSADSTMHLGAFSPHPHHCPGQNPVLHPYYVQHVSSLFSDLEQPCRVASFVFLTMPFMTLIFWEIQICPVKYPVPPYESVCGSLVGQCGSYVHGQNAAGVRLCLPQVIPGMSSSSIPKWAAPSPRCQLVPIEFKMLIFPNCENEYYFLPKT